MADFQSIIFYVLLFLSIYVQVFLLVTFLENKKRLIIRRDSIKLKDYPSVTLVVSCWNEENTVYATVQSLLAMNYPKDKLKLFLIDDGSQDGTWDILRRFENHPGIKIFKKENGGKYTALNLGLEHAETEFFGGMDADSFADPEALVRIMSYFERDSSAMAVVPSVVVHNPKNFVQDAQMAEYHMGVFTKKMFGFLGAINVTPGPLTIFRTKVFRDLGPYSHGHNTEDMEIAYRMQKHGYKIDHCNDAYVFTNTPASVKKLYKQRLRWIYGFINNTLDYRDVLFKKKYGNFSLFALPTGLISLMAICFLFVKLAYEFVLFVHEKIQSLSVVGLSSSISMPKFDLFFLDTSFVVFLFAFIYAFALFTILFGRKMVEGKWIFSPSVIYFIVVFRVLAPLWFLKAIYNTLLKRTPAWR